MEHEPAGGCDLGAPPSSHHPKKKTDGPRALVISAWIGGPSPQEKDGWTQGFGDQCLDWKPDYLSMEH